MSKHNDCGFCGSDQVIEEYPGVFRCKICRSIEVRAGSKLEEDYTGNWLEPCVHEFINTGTQRSWCKHCNADAQWSWQHGKYFTKEDLVLLSWHSSQDAEGYP